MPIQILRHVTSRFAYNMKVYIDVLRSAFFGWALSVSVYSVMIIVKNYGFNVAISVNYFSISGLWLLYVLLSCLVVTIVRSPEV